MDRSEIIETIRAVISEETEIPKEDIQENSLLMRDLELSSLEELAVIGKLEEEYGIHLPQSKLPQITTIGEMADCFIKMSVCKDQMNEI